MPMNEMYNMSVVLHGGFVFLLLGMIVINYALLTVAGELRGYRRKRSVIIFPLDFVSMGGVIFTGIIMMAAKHLEFTIENIVMIVVAILFIVAERKRGKAFKYIQHIDEFERYKAYAKKILMIEFITVVIISIWMFM